MTTSRDSRRHTRSPASGAAGGRADCGAIRDLKQRGLLKETIVVVIGEFGRTATEVSGW